MSFIMPNNKNLLILMITLVVYYGMSLKMKYNYNMINPQKDDMKNSNFW